MNNSQQLNTFPSGRAMFSRECLDIETRSKVSTSLVDINECLAP